MKEKEREGKVLLYKELNDFYQKEVQSQYEAGIDPGMTAEPELPAELLEGAKAFTDTAIISICRFSGERWDRTVEGQADMTGLYKVDVKCLTRAAEVFEHGDFYLSDADKCHAHESIHHHA